MPIILQLTIFLLQTLIGFFIASLIGIKNKIELIGLSILIGSGVTTYAIFLAYDYLHVLINRQLVFKTLLFLSLLFGSLWAVTGKYKSIFYEKVSFRFKDFINWKKNPLGTLFIITIFLTLTLLTIGNLFWPIIDWDAIALYDFRALVISATGSFEDGIRRGYFLQYPPYTSLLHTISYLVGFTRAKLWYSFLYLAMILSFYGVVRRDRSKNQALFGSVVLMLSPVLLNGAQMAYTNLPYTIFISLGYLYILSWIKARQKSYLLVGGLLTAFSTWVRLAEPFWFFSVLLIILGVIIHRKHIVSAIFSLLAIYLLKYPWVAFVAQKQSLKIPEAIVLLPATLGGFDPLLLLVRIPEVTAFFIKNTLSIFYIYLPPLLIILFIYFTKRRWLKLAESMVFFIPLGMIFVGTLLFSVTFPEWKSIPDSAARMSMFLIPIIIYLISNSKIWGFDGKQ